jgi:glyoxylase-like metal-dependent hydrolase (beta-lactamase superfamily II)
MLEPTVATEIVERPPGFVAPDLSPSGLVLQPEELAEGVFALMANRPPKDNNGLIVGDRCALVVDSGITPAVAAQIQQHAAALTDKPIRYLANTTFHGDHTFGNAAFDDDVVVVSSAKNKAAMTDLGDEKHARQESMYGDRSLDTVLRWRLPDLVFDRRLEIDLGGRMVELWHFGPGNGPGDTIVYVPDVKLAWTGNFLVPAGVAPMLLVGDPLRYAATVRAMRQALDIEKFVPGHGFIADAERASRWLIGYLEGLAAEVSRRYRGGQTEDTILTEAIFDGGLTLPVTHAAASAVAALNQSLHRLNVLTTYRILTN